MIWIQNDNNILVKYIGKKISITRRNMRNRTVELIGNSPYILNDWVKDSLILACSCFFTGCRWDIWPLLHRWSIVFQLIIPWASSIVPVWLLFTWYVNTWIFFIGTRLWNVQTKLITNPLQPTSWPTDFIIIV